MWLFQNKKVAIKDLLDGFTDFHSHILPGVDDGVCTMQESLDILHIYEDWGVKAVWFTPHIMEDIPNTTVRLKERFAEVLQTYSGNIQLHLAAEYMLDQVFEERIENNDVLPLGESGNHLLVETSYFSPPMGLRQTLQRILSKGYYPMLAHPERYLYMDNSEYRSLKEMGVKFQFNLFSLGGLYGKTVKKKAEWLSKNNLYDICGSDTHNIKGMDWMKKMNVKENSLDFCRNI